MPWFALTTLLHCILALERRLILTSWVVVLSIGTFTLSMCGTFLVRSGILNSVHTFANDPERGIFILVFLFSLIFLSIFIFIFFHKPDNKSQINFSWLSKEASILFNNWLMMYFLSVVLIGTVYPIFLDVISSEKISVGPPFYHRLIIPFLIPFLLIMAIGPKLSWISTNIKQKLNLIIFLVISFFLAGFIVVNLNVEFLINTILIGSSFYLFFLTLSDLFRNKLINISQNISHFGFSLLILSILFNNIFSSEIITNMKIGEVYKKDKIEINFQKIEQKKEKNFNSIIGTFNITDSENKSITLKPQLRIFNQPNIITSEADIKTTLFSDKFMVMNVVQNQEYFNIRYQIKPFMIWIWISVIIITLGGLVSFYRKI
jgi:cytochrome c-type biogenesis protein CcmF